MELRRLGASGMRVSELALGAMTFGKEAGEAESRAIIDRYLEAGGNLIDTANVYSDGASEAIVGRALAGGRRDDVVIATKFFFDTGPGPNDRGASRLHIRQQVDRSLRRLQTDRIDLYQIHLFDRHTPLEETLSALDDLVHEGKVLYIGACNHPAWVLAKALGISERRGWARFVSYQPEYSLTNRAIEREHVALCQSEGLGLIPWGPLGGGVLTGKYRGQDDPPEGTRAGDVKDVTGHYVRAKLRHELNGAIADEVVAVAAEVGRSPAQVALNWARHRPGMTAPIIGARTVAQLEDNLGALDWTLDVELVERLDAVSKPTV